MDRIDSGKQPVCVESCPTFAVEMGDYDTLVKKYRDQGKEVVQLNPADFPYVYRPGGGTGVDPSFLVVKRAPMKFTEDIG
jgi:Fe-S-cluster-containing dehydrogenase component